VVAEQPPAAAAHPAPVDKDTAAPIAVTNPVEPKPASDASKKSRRKRAAAEAPARDDAAGSTKPAAAEAAAAKQAQAAPPAAKPSQPAAAAAAPAAKPAANKCSKATFAPIYNAAAPTKDAVRAALRSLNACHAAGSISDADYEETQSALVARL